MSEVTAVVTSEQAQSAPVPEQQPSPESVVQEQAALAAEQAAQQEEQARREADDTLKAAVREYRKGEKAYAAALLEAGRLSDLYVHQRLALRDKRAAAVQALEGELAKRSSATVDVNRLIGCYHAYRLLADEPGLVGTGKKPGPAHDVPYGHYRDCWVQLVERQAKDTAQESWVLLPGLEADCLALFATATQDGLSKDAIKDAIRGLLKTYADRQAEAARQAREAAETEARAKAAEQARAAQEAKAAEQAVQQAKQAVQQAKQAVEQAPEGDKAALTEAMKRTEAEQRQRQQAAIAAQAAAEKAARDKARAETAAREAEQARLRAEERERKAEARKAQRSSEPARNVLPSATPTDAAGLAAMIAEAVKDCERPDDMLYALLLRLKETGEFSKQSVRAIDAALTIMSRKPEATVKPSVNGQMAGAA
jgi:hypothetical protein